MNNLNIVDLIEQNPIAKLSDTYNNKLLIKIKETFTGFEQKLFISSFYCYLNYDNDVDFIIDLDNVWKWMGFTVKATAKDLLEKHFKVDIDYKILVNSQSEQDLSNNNERKWGGQNRQNIMLTVNCFKSLCLKARTKKADEIHDYYMKLEKILHQVIEEETDELRQQLEEKDNIITQIKQSSETEKQKLKKEKQRGIEQAIITQFPVNTECIYFGTINNTNDAKENLIKFGHTNDLSTRVLDHRKKYDNFILTEAFRVQNKVEIENLIKNYPKIKRQIRSIEINGKQKTEIIAYDTANFTIEKLTKHIKDIIHSKTYSIDNFNRLMKQTDELEKENRELREELEQYKTKTTKLAVEMNELKETIEKQNISIIAAAAENQSVFQLNPPTNTEQSVYQNALLPEDETTQKFKEFIDEMCIVRQDVEESSTNMEGQYRIWSKTKPKKEIFHALKHYLDTRFKPARISIQNKDQIVHGYIGIKLKEITYKKKLENSTVETFLFQVCNFSPNGKILNSTLLSEYQRWKKSVNIQQTDNDMKEIKDYLNSCEYALKATVWTDVGSNEGYYGISLKSEEHKHKTTSSTGKTVEKRDMANNALLGKWETIAKAAEAEKISAAKMSRSIKNKVTFNDDYFYCIAI
jgi:hypothetical protein